MDRSLLRLVIALPLLSSSAHCEQLTAARVVVGTVNSLPELQDPTKVPPVTLPERTEAAVYFAEIIDTDTDPRPISGAKVRLIHPMAPEGLRLHEDPGDPGNYELSSETDPRLVYLPDQEYRVEVEEDGETYVMRVTLPPAGAAPLAVGSKGKILDHPRNTDLEIPHPDPAKLGFLHVARGPDPATGCPSSVKKRLYSTVPRKASQVIDLLEDDEFWHRDPLVVPGDKLNACGLHAVLVSVVARGFPESNNLFLGSQLFAGWADGMVVRIP